MRDWEDFVPCALLCPALQYASIMVKPALTHDGDASADVCCATWHTQRGSYWRSACVYCCLNPLPVVTQFLPPAAVLHWYLRQETLPDETCEHRTAQAWCCGCSTLMQVSEQVKAAPDETQLEAPPPVAATMGGARHRAQCDYCKL
jgi:hypothetical protein